MLFKKKMQQQNFINIKNQEIANVWPSPSDKSLYMEWKLISNKIFT